MQKLSLTPYESQYTLLFFLFSFSFPDKANLHQLQQPRNLMTTMSTSAEFHPVGMGDGRAVVRREITKALPKGAARRGTAGGPKQKKTRRGCSFHLLSSSQDYTHTHTHKKKKRKNVKIRAWQRLMDGAFLLSVYISAVPSFKNPLRRRRR